MRRYLLVLILIMPSFLPSQAFATDTEPPVITAISPSSGTTQWYGYAGASFRVTDDAGCCTSAVLEIVSQAGQVVKSLSLPQRNPEYPLSTTYAERIYFTGTLLGTFSVRATVTDFSGKSATGALGSIEIYQPDWNPPGIASSSGFSNSSALPGQTLSGSFVVVDDKECCSGASIILFNSSGSQLATASASLATFTSAKNSTYNASIQLPADIAPGSYVIKAQATDLTGKVSYLDDGGALVGNITVIDPNPSPSPSASPSASASPSPSATPTEEPGAPTIPTPTTSTIPTPITSTIPTPTTSTIPTPTTSTIPTPTTSTNPTPVASTAPKVVATPKATALISPTPKPASKPVKIVAPNKQTNAGEAKAAAPKVQTIFCYKGKLLKKVTAPKPVCPKGYVKRK